MPRMSGLQVTDQAIKEKLSAQDRKSIARALGENLAAMQELTWPFSGRYHVDTQSVQPFELRQELAHPFPVEADESIRTIAPQAVTCSESIVARIRHLLLKAATYNDRTSYADIEWVEEILEQAKDALDDNFQPCFVMEDYKDANVVLTNEQGIWRVSGVFDLMEGYFGDGEIDLSRQIGVYLEEGPQLAYEFIHAYVAKKPPRPGFRERFPIYMLHDRLIIWEYFQRNSADWWDDTVTFLRWMERYLSSLLLP